MTEEEKRLKKLQDGQDDGQTPVVPPVEQAPDNARQSLFDSYQQQYNSFADIINAYSNDLKKSQQESEAAQKADVQAARWSNATELAASIANLIGVGQGNAVSQQYSNPSVDWMSKAQEEMHQRRSRMDDVRERQRAMQLQMARLRGEEALQMLRYDQDREARAAELEYNQARIAYQNAQTEYANARTEAERKEAEEKLKYIDAQVKAQEALANQRYASAGATVTRAEAAASEAANRNENRNSRTASQNWYDNARGQAAMMRAAGLNQRLTIPQPGAQAPASSQNDDNTPPSRRNR